MHPFSVLKVMILVHGLEREEGESMRREPSCVTNQGGPGARWATPRYTFRCKEAIERQEGRREGGGRQRIGS